MDQFISLRKNRTKSYRTTCELDESLARTAALLRMSKCKATRLAISHFTSEVLSNPEIQTELRARHAI